MPADTIRKQPPKGKGKGKIAGLDWKIWAGGFVLAVAVGLYLRHHATAAAATSPTTAAAPADAGGVGGASGSSDPNAAAPIDTSGLEDAINNLGYVLGGGGGLFTSAPTTDSSAFAPVSGTSSAPAPVASAMGATGARAAAATSPATSPASVPFSPYPGAPAGETLNLKTGIASLANGTPVVGPQQSPPADVNPGNVASFKVLPSGATLTTLSSGRKIEKAPGKSPYVVHK